MEEAGAFYRRARAVLDARELRIGRLLDFGCGWGRIYRTFLRDSPELVGVDIDEECIDICRTAMPNGTFERCEPDPPLRFPDKSFDVVVAYSVFSHLAEHAFRSWMSELRRLLRPGGHVFFTTLKEAHLRRWDELSRTGNSYYKRSLAAAGFSKRRWERLARKGERILFVPTGGGDVRSHSFYGEAIAPRAFLERVLPELGFRIAELSSDDYLPQVFVAGLRRS